MDNTWVLDVYSEDKPQALSRCLCKSLEKVRDYYDYDHFDIVVRNVGDNFENIDFKVVEKSTQESIAEIEFWPEGYVPIPLDDARKMAEDLGCEIEEI